MERIYGVKYRQREALSRSTPSGINKLRQKVSMHHGMYHPFILAGLPHELLVVRKESGAELN